MHRHLALLLFLLGLALSTWVPGGLIENRDFSHFSSVVPASSNSYLTTMGLGSFMLAYFCFQKKRWAFKSAFVAGISYFFVYIIDLTGVFLTSPSPMITLLTTIEVVGVLLAIPIIVVAAHLSFFSSQSLADTQCINLRSSSFSEAVMISIFLFIISLGTIVFATLAALGEV